jgi:hypothetical protein
MNKFPGREQPQKPSTVRAAGKKHPASNLVKGWKFHFLEKPYISPSSANEKYPSSVIIK